MLEDRLYQMLLERYKLARERTDALSNRAHALLGFSGIINTILVAIILGVLDEEKRIFIVKIPHLQTVVILGFTFYVLSTIFSLLSYMTTRYMPIPQLDSKDFVKDIFSGKTKLSEKHIYFQVIDAIEFYDGVNARKYACLFLGTLFLLIAIALTAIIGIIFFLSIY